MAIVYFFFSSSISSSILRVAIGSSAEHGSSISSTSGSVAMARAMHSRCCWPPDSDRPLCVQLVLDLVPQRGAAQRLLDLLGHVAAVAVQPQAEGHVAVDAHGERVGLLEHHADVAAHRDRVDGRVVDVLAAEVDVALEAEAADQVVHAVEAAQHRALAAAGRADEGRDRCSS